MKRSLVLCFIILSIIFYTNNVIAGRCSGSSNCRACTTCNYCKHCNGGGGTCGVCSGGTANSGSHWFIWVGGIALGGYIIVQIINKRNNKDK